MLGLLLACSGPVLAATPKGRKTNVAGVARKLGADIQLRVSAIRGLPIRRKLRIGVYSKAALRDFVIKELTRSGGRRHLALRSRALRRLGLLPARYELLDGMVGLLDEQVAGLYDPRTRRLRIMSHLVPTGPTAWSPMELLTGSPQDRARFVMAHEIVHALQDQKFNLRRMGRNRPGQSDMETALASLFEGDATAAGLAFMVADKGGYEEAAFFATARMLNWVMKGAMSLARLGLLPDTAALRRTPDLLQRRLVFPYVGGLSLCMTAGQLGGWRAIDALYKNPPVSTEQVLHPSKLLRRRRDHPQALKLPKLARLLGRRYRALYRDTLGELGMRSLLSDAPPGVDANAAAAGWDGDRYVLLGARGKPDALVWLSTWDSPAEAAEFAGALTRWLATRHPKNPRIDVRKSDVLLQLGVPDKVHAPLRERVWLRTKRREITRLPR